MGERRLGIVIDSTLKEPAAVGLLSSVSIHSSEWQEDIARVTAAAELCGLHVFCDHAHKQREGFDGSDTLYAFEWISHRHSSASIVNCIRKWMSSLNG